jgi:glutathione S-transferase
MIHAQDIDGYEGKMREVQRELNWLERVLGQGPYFNDESFSLVDIAYAPLFMRTEMLKLGNVLYPQQDYPKVAAWCARLMELPQLKKSVVADFDTLFKQHIQKKAPYAAQRLGLPPE